MLTTYSDSGVTITCLDNVVNKAREWRNAADKESDNGTPITGVFGRIAVHAVEVIHVWDGDVSASDNIIADMWVSGYERGMWDRGVRTRL